MSRGVDRIISERQKALLQIETMKLELQTSNEEVQFAKEELKTTKQKLRIVTERLNKSNDELKKIKEIHIVAIENIKKTNDMVTLLSSSLKKYKETETAYMNEFKKNKEDKKMLLKEIHEIMNENNNFADVLREAKETISDLRCELIYQKDNEGMLQDPMYQLLKSCRSSYADIHKLKDEQLHLELPTTLINLEKEIRQMKQIVASPNNNWDKTWNNKTLGEMYDERDKLVQKLSQFVVKRKLKALKEDEREIASSWDKVITQDFESAKNLLIQDPTEKVNQEWAKYYEKRMLKHRIKIEIYELENSIVDLRPEEKTDQLTFEYKKQEWHNKMKEFTRLNSCSLVTYSPSAELQKLLPDEAEIQIQDDFDEAKEC